MGKGIFDHVTTSSKVDTASAKSYARWCGSGCQRNNTGVNKRDDGMDKSVEMKTQTNLVVRPMTKVCLVEGV